MVGEEKLKSQCGDSNLFKTKMNSQRYYSGSSSYGDGNDDGGSIGSSYGSSYEPSVGFDNELARQQVPPKYVQPGKKALQNVFLGKKLGKGAFGDVYVGRLEGFPDHRVVAVKCISKRAVSKRDLSTQLAMEIAVHQQLNHPNIIRFYDFTQDERKVYFFLEYAPEGDLFKYVKRYRPNERDLANILYQVGEALAFIHSYGIVHRDLKPENVLMDANHVPKLTDFGYCDRVGDDGYCENPLFCGTTDYFSPWMIDDQPCSYFVDTWAFGVMIFDLLVGHTPFHERTHKQTYERIRRCDVRWNDRLVARATVNCRQLLQSIFVPYSDQVPSMNDVLSDPWFHQ